MPGDLRTFLLEAGAPERDIDRAAAEGWLPLLAVDRILMPGVARHDLPQLAQRAGTDYDTARRIWRSLGFPEPPEGVAVFTDADADMLRLAVSRVDVLDGGRSFERQTRAIASALARVAAVEADVIAEAIEQLRPAACDDEELASMLVALTDWGSIEELIDYTHRLQLRAAVWRRLALEVTGAIDLGVGFADLSGYTALAEELDEPNLAALLERWEALAYDTIAERGGRLVKTIGDEVMFVGLPDEVADIALEVTGRAGEAGGLPAVRAGVACGPLLARDGDYYGPVVNLASRLAERARPGSVLAAEGLHEALHGQAGFAWRNLGRRRIRSIGEVDLWVLRRPAA